MGSQNITVTEWYRGLLQQIVDDLELEIDWEEWWDQNENKGISTVQMFGNFIRKALLPKVAHNDGQAVIFMDEIDSIISLDFGTDDFFAFIRACHNKRAEFPLYNRLTFCLLGVATPSDLIADKTRTPFNIGTAIELTGFTFEEAKDALTPGLAEKVDDPEATLEQILKWTGGQPFLTQKLCNLVVEKAEGSSADIPQLVQTYIINNWEGQDDPEHLRTIRDRILRNEQNTSRLLGLYRQVLTSKVAADASPEQMELRLSGLVVKRNGCLQVYNNIYREIFDQGWIETELNKLRPYSEAINSWLKSGRQDTSRLLRGETLEEALEWGREKSLSVEDYAFLSQEVDRQEEKQALEIEKIKAIKREAELIIAEAKQGIHLEGDGNEALEKFNSEPLSALLMAMKAGQALNRILQRGSWQKEYPATSPLFALQQILAKIKERKHIPHDNSIYSLSFSPNGKMLATASADNTLRLWNLEGTKIAEFLGHTNWVNRVSFSPDGKMLATASADDTARLWDLQGNQIAEFLGHTDSVYSVSFSPDGKILATASYEIVRLWDLSGNQIAELPGHTNSVYSVTFSPDGKFLATASSDKTARLWDLSGNQIAKFVGHTNWVLSVSFSPDGKMLATASSDNTARLWDLSGQQIAELMGHTSSVNSVSFSPDGIMLATASSDKATRLWDLKGNLIAEFSGHSESVNSSSFAKFSGHRESVNSSSFRDDDRLLATPSYEYGSRTLPMELLEEFLKRGCERLRGYFVSHPEALAELEVCRLAADFEADVADG